MNYTIRLATEKDCDTLSRLKQQVWDETYRGIYSDEKIDILILKKIVKNF